MVPESAGKPRRTAGAVGACEHPEHSADASGRGWLRQRGQLAEPWEDDDSLACTTKGAWRFTGHAEPLATHRPGFRK